MSKATYYVVKTEDGFHFTRTVDVNTGFFDTPEEYNRRLQKAFFRTVAERIVFSDCGYDEITEIVADGRPVEYVGWQPGMLVEFRDTETGEIIFSESFPQWDH